LSASCDSQYANKAFAIGLGGVTHPIVSDWHPKGKVAQEWGVYNADRGLPIRSAFVIDKEGIVRFKKIYTGELPTPEELLAELDKLK